MAIDNSSYDSLADTCLKIKEYLDSIELGREHSEMIIKQEEFAHLLENFDVEALEEQSKDIHKLHKQLNDIKEVSEQIIRDLESPNDSVTTANKVVSHLDQVFINIKNIVL